MGHGAHASAAGTHVGFHREQPDWMARAPAPCAGFEPGTLPCRHRGVRGRGGNCSYVLVRALAWSSSAQARLAATAAAFVVACVPAMLIRGDVKQYTSDAFIALVVLVGVRWIDGDPRDWLVVWLGGLGAIAVPFSTTSAFVVVAGFGALLVSALLRRATRKAAATVVVGTGVAAVYAAFFGVVVVPALNANLRDYWQNAYLTGSPIHVLAESWHRLNDLAVFLAMPGVVAVVLFATGIVVLARQGQTALAVTLPLLWLEMFVLGRARVFPFLELRTNLFLIVPSLVIVAMGAADMCAAIFRRRRLLGVAAAAGLAMLFAIGVAPSVRFFGVPNEDIRGQTRYVAAHLGPGDAVVVNALASWGFAYYWPHGHIDIVRSDAVAPGFLAEPSGINAHYATGITYEAVLATLRDALRERSSGPPTRLFVVRTHMNDHERDAWTRAFATLHVQPQEIDTGVEPLAVVTES